MDYEQFITEIQKYWDLRKKGLKNRQTAFCSHLQNLLKKMCRMRMQTLFCFGFAGNTWTR